MQLMSLPDGRLLAALHTKIQTPPGRHLLFFAAAKKSRQKKAANTANISSCLRAPGGPALHAVTRYRLPVANASN
ncbi:hypothetical protein SAMN05446935_5866 [Burkholderia sp. YR290]|nr:hypothetical protein SAMN05446934_4787 [Paraburkholderia hospita]SOE85400.1 hypothetical protein SAMN05446935_5866 [Burkholderia sp. YR290]